MDLLRNDGVETPENIPADSIRCDLNYLNAVPCSLTCLDGYASIAVNQDVDGDPSVNDASFTYFDEIHIDGLGSECKWALLSG